jgi:tRNA(Ile)-lysidine synthase
MPGALSALAHPVPLSAEFFSSLLDPFSPLSGKIAIAVSGGPDSMALAFCVKRWGQRELVALVVDHGLRTESTQEAEQVKERLENMNIAVEILKWQHENVTTRLHEKARDARYRLLTEACTRLGAGDLFVAHHREDQAETVLMRLAKGSGVEGLAGIAITSMRDNIRILRPFLTVAKQNLIATCVAADIHTVADPSNTSDKFARGRLRKIMPVLSNEGMTIDSLNLLGERARETNDALDFYATLFMQTFAIPVQGGCIRIDCDALRKIPRATAARVMAKALRYTHDAGYPPERLALATLLDAILMAQHPTVRSLYGCLLSLTGSQMLILREPAAVAEIIPAMPGQTLLWDTRWSISLPPDITAGSVIKALGNQPHKRIDTLAPGLRRMVPQGRVRATLPALWHGSDLIAIPSFGDSAAFRLSWQKQSFP